MPSGEDDLIGRYFRPLAPEAGALELRDDAAFVTPPAGSDLVLTTDAVIEGVHFLRGDPADTIAKKALRANLSDLAAKGAEPLGFLLTLALPKATEGEWIAAFADGLAADIEAFRCPLLGGDTDQTPGLLSVAIAAFGHVPHGRMVRRAGAKPGDVIVVTGTVGDSALGLRLRREPQLADKVKLNETERACLLERYLVPEPKLKLAKALREHASAAIDISDGLAGDLAKLAAVSGVSARVETGCLPLSAAARKLVAADAALIETVVSGGDDYEILAAVPRAAVAALHRAAKESAIPLTEIGLAEAGGGVEVIGPDKLPMRLARPSFSHF